MPLTVTTIKTVNFLDMLRILQEEEWSALGLETPAPVEARKLPDGREDIHGRLWEEFCNHWHGNQQFGNDRYFIYGFSDEDFWDKNSKEYDYPIAANEDVQKMFHLCKDIMESNKIVFYVCW